VLDNLIWDLFGLAGIMLEIWGFLWMLKYHNKKPTDKQIEKYPEQNVPDKFVNMRAETEYADPLRIGVPQEFADWWKRR